MIKESIKVEDDSTIEKRIAEQNLKTEANKLKEIDASITKTKKLLDLTKKINKVDEEVDKVILTGFRKLKADYEYENNAEFHKLMFEKQQLLNEKRKLQADSDIKTFESTLDKLNDNKKLIEDKIEKIKGEMK